MNHGDDMLITAPTNGRCRLNLDGIYAFGKYENAPDKHGLHFVGLAGGSVINASDIQGNLRITGCARANLLFRTSYEGTVTIEGAAPEHDGCIGFLTRLATATRPALRVCDNQHLVMSDFYVESSDQIAVFSGIPGQTGGAATIQSPKVEMHTDNPVLDISNYSGRIYFGQSQFYGKPSVTLFRSSETNMLNMMLAGNVWYDNRPSFDLNPATSLTLLGNSGVADTTMTPQALDALSDPLDDLRRLGKLDLDLSRAEP
jgi:hypothetical protein